MRREENRWPLVERVGEFRHWVLVELAVAVILLAWPLDSKPQDLHDMHILAGSGISGRVPDAMKAPVSRKGERP